MRYLLIGLGALMLLFAGVQYNDPDGLFWAIIYLIPALFALFAAVRPSVLGAGTGQAVLVIAIVAAAMRSRQSGKLDSQPSRTRTASIDHPSQSRSSR